MQLQQSGYAHICAALLAPNAVPSHALSILAIMIPPLNLMASTEVPVTMGCLQKRGDKVRSHKYARWFQCFTSPICCRFGEKGQFRGRKAVCPFPICMCDLRLALEIFVTGTLQQILQVYLDEVLASFWCDLLCMRTRVRRCVLF